MIHYLWSSASESKAEVMIITLMASQILSAHRRWQVFRGESTDSKDLLFSVKKSRLLQFKTELHVIMASNTNEEACDFKIKGSYFERSCTVYLGESNSIVAQVREIIIINYHLYSHHLIDDVY